MAFNASDFRSRMKFGGARPNLFEVSVVFPAVAGATAAADFTYKCQAAAMPGFILGNAESFYFGRRVNFPGDREWQPFQCEVIVDEDYLVRNAFEKWQNQLNLVDHNTNQITKQYYFADVVVRQFGKDKRVIKTATMKNAYPMDIGELSLAWQDNNRIMTFPVVFMYDYCVTDVANGG